MDALCHSPSCYLLEFVHWVRFPESHAAASRMDTSRSLATTPRLETTEKFYKRAVTIQEAKQFFSIAPVGMKVKAPKTIEAA